MPGPPVINISQSGTAVLRSKHDKEAHTQTNALDDIHPQLKSD